MFVLQIDVQNIVINQIIWPEAGKHTAACMMHCAEHSACAGHASQLSVLNGAVCIAAAESKLLQARVKMQQKYLDQYMELYEVSSAARTQLGPQHHTEQQTSVLSSRALLSSSRPVHVGKTPYACCRTSTL
jgi:anion-transporting  ArsA/GET3 family ATPase